MENIFATIGERWIVDRFEEKWAMLENAATLETMPVRRTELPQGIKPGDTLIMCKDGWQLDHAETEARKQRIDYLLNKIKSKKSGQ